MHAYLCVLNPHSYGSRGLSLCFHVIKEGGKQRPACKELTGMGTLECWGGTDVITAAHSQVHLFTMRSFFCMLMTWRIQSDV